MYKLLIYYLLKDDGMHTLQLNEHLSSKHLLTDWTELTNMPDST